MRNYLELDCKMPHKAFLFPSTDVLEDLNMREWQKMGNPHVLVAAAKYQDNCGRVYIGLIDYAYGYKAVAFQRDDSSLLMLSWAKGDFVMVEGFESLAFVVSRQDAYIYKRVSD